MNQLVDGFDKRTLSYTEVTIEDRTLYVAAGYSEYAFWVSEKGPGDPCPYFVSLEGPKRINGSRSVLGCTCQASGVAHECIHTRAARAFSTRETKRR